MPEELNINQRDNVIDNFEKEMKKYEPAKTEVEHIFLDKMYGRVCRVKKDTLFTTRTHKTEHPLVILKGIIKIYDGDEPVVVEAPKILVTKPNTRRLIYVVEDVEAVTFHVTDKTNVRDIADELLEPIEEDDYHKSFSRISNFYNENTNKVGGKICHS